MDEVLAAIGLSGTAASIIAAMILIVGIAMAFKGGDVGKRVVRKV